MKFDTSNALSFIPHTIGFGRFVKVRDFFAANNLDKTTTVIVTPAAMRYSWQKEVPGVTLMTPEWVRSKELDISKTYILDEVHPDQFKPTVKKLHDVGVKRLIVLLNQDYHKANGRGEYELLNELLNQGETL